MIGLYHGRATSEQFLSELKSGMGLERLPSGKLAVNKIVLAVAMNVYNALKLLGQKSINIFTQVCIRIAALQRLRFYKNFVYILNALNFDKKC